MSISEERSPYITLGEEPGVRRLVNRFYDLMEEREDAATIRAMHPENLDESRQKLIEFLSGFLGGPPLYMERRGHPRLCQRHQSFTIDESARDAWIACMHQALEEQVQDKLMLLQLKSSFYRTAHHMINTD
jgi:hemoglobin